MNGLLDHIFKISILPLDRTAENTTACQSGPGSNDNGKFGHNLLISKSKNSMSNAV